MYHGKVKLKKWLYIIEVKIFTKKRTILKKEDKNVTQFKINSNT